MGGRDDSWNSVLDIEWDSGKNNRYRVGLDGKMDLHAVVGSSGGFVYAEHLPKLRKLRCKLASYLNMRDTG